MILLCFAGVSRSATITIAFLMLKEGLVLEQAFDDVRRSRPFISPNPGTVCHISATFLRMLARLTPPSLPPGCVPSVYAAFDANKVQKTLSLVMHMAAELAPCYSQKLQSPQ